MTVNQTQLDNFHEFATRALANAGRELNLEELVDQWSVEREQLETIASIQRGVADAESGRVHDLTAVDAQIRTTLGFQPRGK